MYCKKGKINILHISRQFYPFMGGTEKYIFEISKRIINYEFNCRVLTLNYSIINKKLKLSDYEKNECGEIFRIPGFGHYKKPFPLRVPLKLFKWADIVHIHDVRFLFETSIFLKWFFKYKIVFSTHGFLFHTKDLKFLKKIMIPFYYRPLFNKFIDKIICDSKQDFEYFKDFGFKNIILLENGIDFYKFSNIKREPKLKNFLYFGRIDKNKGLDLLLQVLSLLKIYDWKLDIIGDGQVDLINSLKNLTYKLNLSNKVNLLGFVEQKKLHNYLAKAHLCFFPSTHEGFGFTLLEAMATGCICIASNIDTFKSILKNNFEGYITDFLDFKKTAELIENLLKKPLLELNFISNNARGKAMLYDWHIKIEQLIEIYKKVLN